MNETTQARVLKKYKHLEIVLTDQLPMEGLGGFAIVITPTSDTDIKRRSQSSETQAIIMALRDLLIESPGTDAFKKQLVEQAKVFLNFALDSGYILFPLGVNIEQGEWGIFDSEKVKEIELEALQTALYDPAGGILELLCQLSGMFPMQGYSLSFALLDMVTVWSRQYANREDLMNEFSLAKEIPVGQLFDEALGKVVLLKDWPGQWLAKYGENEEIKSLQQAIKILERYQPVTG